MRRDHSSNTPGSGQFPLSRRQGCDVIQWSRAGVGVYLIALIVGMVAWSVPSWAWAQTIGDEPEMERLRVRAEDAIANDDPETAVMNMGRAALMAQLLAKTHREDVLAVRLFQSAETLFRSQEHGYRAMALFRRAGGQLPASSGVCGSLSLAYTSVHQTVSALGHEEPMQGPRAAKAIQLREAATDWVTVIDSMIADYQCQ
jgi:hypothetical protein